jgi:hypothetical protein
MKSSQSEQRNEKNERCNESDEQEQNKQQEKRICGGGVHGLKLKDKEHSTQFVHLIL